METDLVQTNDNTATEILVLWKTFPPELYYTRPFPLSPNEAPYSWLKNGKTDAAKALVLEVYR